MEQRAGDAAGDGHAADRIAERHDALRQRTFEFGRRHRIADAAARPERGTVEAADIAFRALVAVRAAACVDDVRVRRANMYEGELVLLPDRRQAVGQEHVGSLGGYMQDRSEKHTSELQSLMRI